MSHPFAIVPPQNRLTSLQRWILLVFASYVLLVGLSHYAGLWYLTENGISDVSKRLPYWDFTNLWSGSRMALEGHIDRVFDPASYRVELARLHGLALPEHEWSYPPSLLLIGVPLALMPIWLAYGLWSAGTLFLWHLAVRPFGLPRVAHFFVVFSPAALINLLLGQNDALMAALLVGGLALAPRRPVVAGILFGLLTLKPHLGLLVPFCLLASWNFRAIISAGMTTVALIVLTGLAFGFDVWVQFMEVTRPLMVSVLETPYPHPYQSNAITAFVFLRSLGADLTIAYIGQAAVILIASGLAIHLWRPANTLDHGSRVALTSVLVLMATPYGYNYDCLPLYLALAWFLFRLERPNLLVISVLWYFPYLVIQSNKLLISLGFFGPALLVAWLLFRIGQRPPAGLRAS
jgi:glycosyl transferase family 87